MPVGIQVLNLSEFSVDKKPPVFAEVASRRVCEVCMQSTAVALTLTAACSAVLGSSAHSCLSFHTSPGVRWVCRTALAPTEHCRWQNHFGSSEQVGALELRCPSGCSGSQLLFFVCQGEQSGCDCSLNRCCVAGRARSSSRSPGQGSSGMLPCMVLLCPGAAVPARDASLLLTSATH